MAPRRLRLITTAAAVVLIGAAAALVSWRYVFRLPIEPMVDLQVYERAGEAVRHGHRIYESGDTRLVFTYPPFAALAAVVIAPLTGWWGQFVWTVATVLALVGVVLLSFRSLLARVSTAWRPLAAGALVVVASVSHPLVEHVFYGQVNVFLVLLCLTDVQLLRGRRRQGVLVGVATALKLTPGVFAVYLWVIGRRRAALTAAVTFAAATALAFALVPSSSVDFWTREIYEGQRIAGSVTYTSNQSLLGLIARVLPDGTATPVWLAAAIAVAVVGFVRARAAHDAGDDLGGFALVALLAVLLSPIAWIHHFVWFVPVVGALVANGRDRGRVIAAAVVTGLLLLRLPWWGWGLLDEGPLLAPIGVVLHNAYTLLALALLIGYPIRHTGARPPSGTSGAASQVASGDGRTWRNGTDRAVPARR